MVRLGYSRGYRRHFDRTWRKLAQYAADRGVSALSVDLTEAFLLHCYVGSFAPEASAASGQQHLTAAMRYLLEFQQHGCFQRRRSAPNVRLPDVMSHVLDAFMRFCTEERRFRPQRSDDEENLVAGVRPNGARARCRTNVMPRSRKMVRARHGTWARPCRSPSMRGKRQAKLRRNRPARAAPDAPSGCETARARETRTQCCRSAPPRAAHRRTGRACRAVSCRSD